MTPLPHWSDALHHLQPCAEAMRYARRQASFAMAWAGCPEAGWQEWLVRRSPAQRVYEAALEEPQRVYGAAMAKAQRVYEATRAEAWHAYEAAWTEARRVYEATTAEAWHAYEAAWTEARRVYEAALEEPQRVYGAALAEALTAAYPVVAAWVAAGCPREGAA